MTGEEMERAIGFLLQGRANFETRLEQTNQQIAETNRQLQITAETLNRLADAVERNIRENLNGNS